MGSISTTVSIDSLKNMKPSVALELKRIAIREATGRYRATNPRVFGSVLHG